MRLVDIPAKRKSPKIPEAMCRLSANPEDMPSFPACHHVSNIEWTGVIGWEGKSSQSRRRHPRACPEDLQRIDFIKRD
ncbi:hypothetical protein I3J13_19600 [Agrobacterium sp. MOPV5]|uniref:hypothetical protein n=1 Tax=Agrobacterium leguminum TaxID=2792015 RepID=UPI0018C26172|nr:hypothetical protein [Agrobacterium leguminum]MBG0510993.1 hypothetical protein [Agrobacterium leguminum]